MTRFLFTCAACLLCLHAQAQQVYKCSEGGKTSYGDRPCEGGAGKPLPPAPGGMVPTGVVETGDARALLELQKMREQQLFAERRQRLQREEREERASARLGRQAAARRQKCDKLRLRLKWAEEDAARAGGHTREAAQRKARRQAQTVAVECRG